MTFDGFVRDFLAAERCRAGEVRSYGAPEPASVAEQLLTRLQVAFETWRLEAIPVNQAAEESGYTPGQIRAMAKAGRLEALNGSGRLLVRRDGLPRKVPGANAQSGTPARIDELERRLHPVGRALAQRQVKAP
jgi:hypothetical protein